jgi:hypothetical protein
MQDGGSEDFVVVKVVGAKNSVVSRMVVEVTCAVLLVVSAAMPALQIHPQVWFPNRGDKQPSVPHIAVLLVSRLTVSDFLLALGAFA